MGSFKIPLPWVRGLLGFNLLSVSRSSNVLDGLVAHTLLDRTSWQLAC